MKKLFLLLLLFIPSLSFAQDYFYDLDCGQVLYGSSARFDTLGTCNQVTYNGDSEFLGDETSSFGNYQLWQVPSYVPNQNLFGSYHHFYYYTDITPNASSSCAGVLGGGFNSTLSQNPPPNTQIFASYYLCMNALPDGMGNVNDSSSTLPVLPPTREYLDCSEFSLVSFDYLLCGFKNVGIALFYPTPSKYSEFTNFGLSSRAPFVYVFQIKDMILGIFTDDSRGSSSFTVPIFGRQFVIASRETLDIFHLASLIKLAVGASITYAFAVAFYHKILNFFH